jgi:hypothetical protein
MKNLENPPTAGTAAKIGAWLFALWGVLHVWVGGPVLWFLAILLTPFGLPGTRRKSGQPINP